MKKNPAMDAAPPHAEFEKQASKFLENDFSQCFQQMRHYDAQIIDICKFALTGYAAIVGTALTLYKYGSDNDTDYSKPAVAIMVIGILLGLCLLSLMVRNRVYFVVVARYVNEHRQHFLSQEPLGFRNRSGMYTNPKQPRFYDWRSSQGLLIYTLALLNSGMIAVTAYIVRASAAPHWSSAALCGLVFLIAQITCSVTYLVTREGRSADAAVFGQE
jgi:hypothetical protein